MADPTRGRGRDDTGAAVMHARAAAPFAPVRTSRPRAFVLAIWVAALLHLPLIPSNLFGWLRFWLEARDMELAEVDGEAIIPIDLDLTNDQDPSAAPPPAPAEPDAVPTNLPARPPKRGDDALDAGVDASEEAVDAGPDAGDAGRPDAGAPDAAAPLRADAGPRPSEPLAAIPSASTDAGIAPVRDPFAIAGGPSAVAKGDNNVKILIASDRLRNHELGPEFGQLLTNIPEWRSFFAGTQLDPIRDLDHLLISGPQLRDSRKVVAVMDYNVSETKMRGAIDLLVDRSKPEGEWVQGAPVPTAIAKADRGERLFALVPGKRLLAVLPPDLKDQLDSLKGMKPFNKSSGVGIVVFLVTPSRAFRGGPVKIPDTLKWLRLSVTPTGDGGADAVVESLDASPDAAASHVAELNDALEQIRKPDLGPLAGLAKIELFDPVHLVADGATIRGKAHVTRAQLRFVMGRAQQYMASKAPPPNAPPPSPPPP